MICNNTLGTTLFNVGHTVVCRRVPMDQFNPIAIEARVRRLISDGECFGPGAVRMIDDAIREAVAPLPPSCARVLIKEWETCAIAGYGPDVFKRLSA